MKIAKSTFGRKAVIATFFLFLLAFVTACVNVDENGDGTPNTIINNEDDTPDVVIDNDESPDTIINTTTNTNTTTVIVNNTQTTPARPQTYTVDIANYAYAPEEMRIQKGDTVVWTNQDSVSHTVTSDIGNELDSPLFSRGQTYSHTFDEEGRFPYYCIPHPLMKGTIIVE